MVKPLSCDYRNILQIAHSLLRAAHDCEALASGIDGLVLRVGGARFEPSWIFHVALEGRFAIGVAM
jgi:hypothetical protein